MAGLKAIKIKIRSIEKTGKVTKAMEAVSASKMRKAQSRALAGRAYARASVAILARISGSRELSTHTLTEDKPLSRALYIVVTSDKGLAGALNSAVLRSTQEHIKRAGLSPQQVTIYAIGRKANDFFVARGYKVEKFYHNTEEVTSARMREIIDEAALKFQLPEAALESVSRVNIAYQNFFSTFEQRPTIRTIFPLALSELEAVVNDIVPVRGVFSEVGAVVGPRTYAIEPSEEEVLSAIIPRLASIFLYHALLESQASEHSARMVAMKSASDKAEELQDSFTLQFNKARQAAITREVSEITGGMEAMSA